MKFKVACIQLCSSDNVDENLSKILNFSKQAIEDNAEFITTPENSSLFSLDKQELLAKLNKRGFQIEMSKLQNILNKIFFK